MKLKQSFILKISAGTKRCYLSGSLEKENLGALEQPGSITISPVFPAARCPEELVFPVELPGPPTTPQQCVISRTTPWFCFAVGNIWLCLVLCRNQAAFCGLAVIPVV